MASNTTVNGTYVPGLLNSIQTGVPYMPQGGFVGPLLGNSAATSPITPKSQYTANVAQNMPQSQPQDLSNQFANVNGTIYNMQTGQGYPTPAQFAAAVGLNPNNINWNNLVFNTTWKPTQSQPSVIAGQNTNAGGPGNNFNPLPNGNGSSTNISNNANGTSTGIAGQGSYDPYNSPAYQQYLQNYVAASQVTPAEQQYLQQLAGSQSSEALGLANLTGDVLPMDILSGQQNVLRQQAQAQQAGIQANLSAAQAQQQFGINAAQAGLNTANAQAGYLGGLATPTPISPGQNLTQFNPTTGQISSLGGLSSFAAGTNTQTGAPYTYNQITGAINPGGTTSSLGATPPTLGGQVIAPTDPYYSTLQTAAELLASNQVSAAQNIMSGMPSAVQAQVYQMAQQQGYNANTAAGAAAAEQSNTETAGIANTNLANTIFQSSGQAYSDFQTGLTKVQSLGQNVLDAMPSGINPSDSTVYNSIVQDFKKNFASNPQYSALAAAINNLQSQVGSMLGSGLIPSSATQDAQAVISGSLPINSMKSVINQILQDGSSINQSNFAQMTQAGQSLANTASSNSNTANNSWNYQPPY